MAKWSEKHMYNWTGWMRSLYALYNKILCWTVTPTSPFKFAIFTLNITVGSILLGLIIGLMAIPQTLEWIMRNIVDEVEKLGKGGSEGIKHNIREFTFVMLALFVLIPYTVTWGLPKLIMEYKINRKIKKTIEVENYTRVDYGSHTYPVGEVEILWPYAKPKEDFVPKRELKAHRMVEPRTLTTGNYSIAFGGNNTVRGNHSISPWPSDVTITTHTEGGVTTAMVRHNIINNE